MPVKLVPITAKYRRHLELVGKKFTIRGGLKVLDQLRQFRPHYVGWHQFRDHLLGIAKAQRPWL